MGGKWLALGMAGLYLTVLATVGWVLGRRKYDSNQYLNASAAMPVWLCTAAAIAANCGSLDVVGMMALGAQYGMAACHFYWIGSIPALLVVAFWLLPAYRRSGAPTILDFVGRYYGRETRAVVALAMATVMLLIAGVSLCAFAQVLGAFLGWGFWTAVLVGAPLVLFYTWSGGFRATVASDLLYFALVVVAVAPVAFLVMGRLGGFRAMLAALPTDRVHVWQGMPLVNPQAPMDVLGVVVGLGVLMSFSFWATDFVQMQRALAVKRPEDAPLLPLSVAGAKLVFSFLIVVPGVAASLVLGGHGLGGRWNTVLPRLLQELDTPGWLVVGFLGIGASLLATFSSNVAGFSSAWVQGVYQEWVRPGATDAHYKRVSRATVVGAVVLSAGTAGLALHFGSLMEYIQLVLSTMNAPLFALVLLAMVRPGRKVLGGRVGFLSGLGVAVLHQVLVLAGELHYGSQMAANFYGAMLGFGVALGVTAVVGRVWVAGSGAARELQVGERLRLGPGVIALGVGIAAVTVALNVVFR